MPYATTTFTAVAGDLTYGPLTFTVISSDEVTVTVGGVTETDFTYDASSGTITFDASVTFTGGEVIVAQRATDIQDPRVVYNPGSPILANDLNVSNAQLLNAIQDLNDKDGNLDVEIDANRQRITQLETDLATETSERQTADTTLQSNIDAEEAARIAADGDLTVLIGQVGQARVDGDAILQAQIDTINTEIGDNDTDISSLNGRVSTLETEVADNDADISDLYSKHNTQNFQILGLQTDVQENADDIAANTQSINTNAGTILVQGNQIVSVLAVANAAQAEADNNTQRNDQQDITIAGIGGIAGQGVTDAAAAQATADTAEGIALSNSSAIGTLNVFTGAVNPAQAGVQDVVSGYRSIVTPYYDPNTVNSVQQLLAETWTGIVPDVYLDESHEIDTMAPQTTYDSAIGRWYLAGTQPGTHCIARILYQITPDEDESQLDLRLNFVTNPDTIATGLFTFNVEAVATVMSQGADIPYTDEVLISFFVGDTLFGPDQANAGSFTVQAKSSVDADFEVLSVTLNTYY